MAIIALEEIHMSVFKSDNTSGVHPKIMAAISAANDGSAMPYGDDEISVRLSAVFSEMFEKDVAVIPCSTGTSANSLALSLYAGGVNSVMVHRDSHVYVDECNAPEFFSGARLVQVDGENGKMRPETLAPHITKVDPRHTAQPSALSLTQVTELGTVYSLDEIKALTDLAKSQNMAVHMDGARFANAVAALGCTAAEMTWKAGVDVVSLGLTKNGAMAAEAVILFDPSRAHEAHLRQKRAGQLLSKQRFLAAQLMAMADGDLWLDIARKANTKTARLCNALADIDGAEIPERIESNMVFIRLQPDQTVRLEEAGLAGYPFGENRMRIVCSWATTDADVDRFIELVRGA